MPFFTGSISSADPFVDVSKLEMNYLPGYAPNVIDASEPFSLVRPREQQSIIQRVGQNTQKIVSQIPLTAAMTLVFTIGVPIFLCNSVVQSIRSNRRIRLHELNRISAGLSYGTIFSKLEDIDDKIMPAPDAMPKTSTRPFEDHALSQQSPSSTWELAVSEEQRAMINNLHGIFRRFFVHIHKARHSHAAIIVRARYGSGNTFDEGKVVIKHWLAHEFHNQ